MPLTAAEAHFSSVAPEYMRRFMADFAAGELDAAAVFGNAGYESLGFTLLQEQKPTVAGSRGGYGWFQWTGSRRRHFEDYCERNGYAPASDLANYKFLYVELKGPEKNALLALKAHDTLDEKVVAFEAAFERAGVKAYPKRKKWARIALEALRAAPALPTQPEPETPASEPPKDFWGLLLNLALKLLAAIGKWLGRK